MTAEAKHYKESLALEKAMQNNASNQNEWVKQQEKQLDIEEANNTIIPEEVEEEMQ